MFLKVRVNIIRANSVHIFFAFGKANKSKFNMDKKGRGEEL